MWLCAWEMIRWKEEDKENDLFPPGTERLRASCLRVQHVSLWTPPRIVKSKGQMEESCYVNGKKGRSTGFAMNLWIKTYQNALKFYMIQGTKLGEIFYGWLET
jgi:hypothetical protein